MRSKISLQWSLFIVGIAVIASSIVISLFDMPALSSPILPPPYVRVMQAQAGVGLPVRLKIPRISVDAAVEHLGLTPQGAMAVPEGPADVAWYDLGPRPGDVGSAVIAGHVGWKDNREAAFDNVSSLHAGDTLSVEDSTGTTTTFVVRELRMYDENQDDSNVFNSSDGKAHLNLIACEGVWNAVTKNYSKRLVVFTDKE